MKCNFDGTKFHSANIVRGYLIGDEEANRQDDVLLNYDILLNPISVGGSVFTQS